MIITANAWFGQAPPISRYRSWDDWLRRFVMKHMLRHGVHVRPAAEGRPALLAIIRQGKWLVLCENPTCHGAEKVWEEGLVMCCSCLNSHVNHELLRTEFPADRARIEEMLEPRPLDNRNWEPPETVEDLEQENIDHMVEVN